MDEKNLILRTIEEQDQEVILDILTSSRVNQTYMLPDYESREAALPLFRRLAELSHDKKRFVRCIDVNNRAVGFVNDTGIEDGSIELGYVIHPNHHGKGYMTQALDLAMKELFSLGYRTVICGAFEENRASIRVMEKCGMIQMEKTETLPYRGRDHKCVYYSKKAESTMLKYKCLVLDHDDTVVQTERHIGFPYFKKYLDEIRPGNNLTFAEYLHDCSGVVFPDMCRKRWNMTDEECDREYQGWKEYYTDTPHTIFPGIDRIIKRQKEAGGLVCVATLSPRGNILQDYRMHFDMEPDAIYDHDMPTSMRKPNPFPLTDIMEKFHLKPEDILVVDDLKMGWQMAQAVKVDAAYAAWSKVDFPELRREMEQLCQYSFTRVEDLEAFLFDEV